MIPDLLATPRRRKLALACLYVVEGAPIGYLWTALPTKLRREGVAVEDVALLASLITLPWSVKFLWAPLVDALRSPRFGLRPWIAGAQLAMGTTLLPLAFIDLTADSDLLVALLMAHAACAATQDVAIDALAVKHVPVAERGAATAWMQVGMIAGRAVFGGVALAVEPLVGLKVVVFLLVGTIWCSSLIALSARDRAGEQAGARWAERLVGFGRMLRRVLRHRATWFGFVFAALAGAGMETTGGLAGPLLIDRGYTQGEAGQFFAFPAIAAMAAGVVVGGRLADRLRRVRAVGVALVGTALCIGLVATAAAPVVEARWFLPASLTVAYVLFGVLTAASYALLMDLTDPSLGGTQFSAYMGAVNLCYVWSVWSGGQLASRFDYGATFLIMAAVSLGALALLPEIGRRTFQRTADRNETEG